MERGRLMSVWCDAVEECGKADNYTQCFLRAVGVVRDDGNEPQ